MEQKFYKKIMNINFDDNITGTILDSELFCNILHIFEPYAIMDQNVFNKNVELSVGEGPNNTMSLEDRSIALDTLNYMLINVPYFATNLLMRNDFREVVKDAVAIEIRLDTEKDDIVEEVRQSMKNNNSSTLMFTVGVFELSPAIKSFYVDEMNKNFQSMVVFENNFQNIVKKLTVRDKQIIGFILSNFMYFIRALAKNDKFVDYIITACEDLSTTTHVSSSGMVHGGFGGKF